MVFLIIAMVYLIDYGSGLICTNVIGTWDGAQ